MHHLLVAIALVSNLYLPRKSGLWVPSRELLELPTPELVRAQLQPHEARGIRAGALRHRARSGGGGGGGDGTEPADPGSGYLWSDNFDRYASAAAMFSGGGCGSGTDAFGLPDAQATYGTRTLPNSFDGCNFDFPHMSLTTGRGGSGKAIRNDVQSDPLHHQQGFTWLSPWSASGGNWGTYSSTGAIVAQIWFRASSGGTPAPLGCKWLELWYVGGASRMQVGMEGADGQTFHVSNDGRSVAALQPVGPYWSSVNNNAWHWFTIAAKRNTTGVAACGGTCGPYSSSRDGYVRAWIDGTKIIDLSAAAAGITPPGGTKVWCTLAEVDEIVPDNYKYSKIADTFNGTDVAFTLDFDDYKVWVI